MPDQPATGKSGPSMSDAFGFRLDDERWTLRVREFTDDSPLGRVGPFEILAEAGHGGQGVVFKARQPRTGREVAIKRLTAGAFATPEMRARFDREIEAAVALDHPNIVTVFGTEVVDGQQLLAMKWIDGAPIDRWVRPPESARRGTREILEIFAIVCDAVHHAHQRGVIHRDLKPSNILVDRTGQPHVLDFGLAKFSGTGQLAESVTMTGAFLGTPAYAAPEQLRGEIKGVDIRTDVYALGAILYRLLTGRLPFTDSGDLPALMQEVIGREAARPSTIDASLDREVDVIVLKALAKEKDDRYGSADALATDIRRYLAGQAVLAHPPSTTYQVRKFVRRHRGAVASLATIAVLLLAATVTSIILLGRANRERDRADTALVEQKRLTEEANRQSERATRESDKASTTVQFITRILSRANRGEEKGNPDVTVREALDAAVTELDETPGKYAPEVEGEIRLTMGDTYDGLGIATAAVGQYEKALILLKQGTNELRVADCMHRLGSLYRRAGRLNEAREQLEGALAIRRRLIPNPKDPFFPQTYTSLGILARQTGDFAAAESYYLLALEGYRQSLGPEDENVGRQLKNLGVLNMYRKRWDEAEDYLRQAQDFFGRNSPNENELWLAKEHLAVVLTRSGDATGEGEQILRDSLARGTQIFGPTHPGVATSAINLADLRRRKGDFKDALGFAETAVRHVEAARLRAAIAMYSECADQLDRPVEAEAFLREAMAQRVSALGSAHPAIGYFEFILARLCLRSERFSETEELIGPAWEKLQAGDIITDVEKQRVAEVGVKLYEQWEAKEPGLGHGDKAAPWRERFDLFAPERAEMGASGNK